MPQESQGSQKLAGRCCMVTGATSGIGKAAALELARRGAELVLVARSRERGEATREEIRAATGNTAVELMLADLGSQAEIHQLAKDFLARDRPLHVLLNNAGVILLKREETIDGIEKTLAVNHLAYFLLSRLLLERLRASAPARIVNVASDAHAFAGGRLDFEDLESRERYSSFRVYAKSKLANILFTRELARQTAGSGVTVNCLHPGFVGSSFGRNNGRLGNLAMTLLRPFARSPEQGAQTAVTLCSDPQLADVSGEYFIDEKIRSPKPFATNDDDARRLWAWSEERTGLSA